MIVDKIRELGYEFEPAPLQHRSFHSAVRSGSLVFSSGQLPTHGDMQFKGRVGEDVDLPTAQKAAEVCAFNCLRAIGAVVDLEKVTRVVKVLGMVNVAPGFDDTPSVINGATDFFNKVFGADNTHARSAVGMILPNNWAVEVEIVAECAE